MKRVERWRGGPAGKCIIIYTQAPGERELCIVRAAAFLCVSDGEGRPAAVFLPPSLLPSNHSALTIRARLVISNLNSFFSSFRCKTISQHSNGNRVGGDARGSFFVASLRSFNKMRTRQPKTQKRRGGANHHRSNGQQQPVSLPNISTHTFIGTYWTRKNDLSSEKGRNVLVIKLHGGFFFCFFVDCGLVSGGGRELGPSPEISKN